MDLQDSIHQLLQEIGPGRMDSVAYDTAWVARLAKLGEPIGEQALDWLRENQLPDGSWGAAEPVYYHDRLVSTLAAMIALGERKDRRDLPRLRRARERLEDLAANLNKDPAGETIGFEMILPTLVSEAQALGVVGNPGNGALGKLVGRLKRYRAAKLASLPEGMINRFVSVAFSAEMAGWDGKLLFDVENLKEQNSSVATSPSATAYYILHIQQQDRYAIQYLRSIVNADGGMPDVAPFDIFEQSWVLWNLMLPNISEIQRKAYSSIEFLRCAWDPEQGVGHTIYYTPNEGDDTSLTYEVLRRCDRVVSLEAILYYEQDDYFRCFDLEANPSISTNIHALSALRGAGLPVEHPSVQKILRFLHRVQTGGMFWFDKWHASPYYPTSHAVIACAGYDDDLIDDVVYWMLVTQRKDGSWGYYFPTAEETSYCLQALVFWKRYGGTIPDAVLERGYTWLVEHAEPPYPPLWIGKALYCPKLVVRSAILSALCLVDQM